MSRHYDFSLPAVVNSSRLIQAMGTRCKLVSNSIGTLQVRTNTGDIFDLLPGQGFDTRDTAPFRELTIINVGGIATTGTIFVGDERFIDDRVTGTVDVVDGERNKVSSGLCFRVGGSQNGAAAAAVVGLMNPAASTKNVFVQAVRIGASAADSWSLCRTSSNLLTAGGILTSQTSGTNIDPTGPGSAVTCCGGNPAAGLGAFAGLAVFASGYAQAAADSVMVSPRPILLRPGFGVILSATAGATNIRTAWEWEEWPLL